MSAWLIPADQGLVAALPGYEMSSALADAGETRLGGGHLRCEADVDLGEWVLTYDEVVTVVAGSMTVTVDGVAHTARAGEALLLATGARVAYRLEAGTRAVYVITPPRAVPTPA